MKPFELYRSVRKDLTLAEWSQVQAAKSRSFFGSLSGNSQYTGKSRNVLTYEGGELKFSDPVQEAYVKIALNRVANAKQDDEYAHIIGIYKDFSDIDLRGKLSRVEMRFAQRIKQLKIERARCPEPNKNVLDAIFDSDCFDQLFNQMRGYCERIRTYRDAAKDCPDPEEDTNIALEDLANWMEKPENAKHNNLAVWDMDEILTLMEWVAGIKKSDGIHTLSEGNLALGVCKKYVPNLPVTFQRIVISKKDGKSSTTLVEEKGWWKPNEIPVGDAVKKIIPSKIEIEVSIPIVEHARMQEATADPKNLGKSMEDIISREVAEQSSQSKYEWLHQYAVATIQSALNDRWVSILANDCLIVDGKDCFRHAIEFYGDRLPIKDKSAWMQYVYNTKMPYVSPHWGDFMKWYETNYKQFCAQIVFDALWNNKPVTIRRKYTDDISVQLEIVQPSPTTLFEQYAISRKPLTDDETQEVDEAFEKTLDSEKPELDKVTVENCTFEIEPVQAAYIRIALNRVKQAGLPKQGNEFPGIFELYKDFLGVDSRGKLSRIEMVFAQRVERLNLIAPMCTEPNKKVLDQFLKTDFLGDLSKDPARGYFLTIWLLRATAKECLDKDASKFLEAKANEWEQKALDDGQWEFGVPQIENMDKVLTVMEQVAGMKAGALNPEAIQLCKQRNPNLPLTTELLTGKNVQYRAPEKFQIPFPNAENIFMQEVLADPKNFGKPQKEIDEQVKKGTWNAKRSQCKNQCETAAIQNAMSVLFGSHERVMGKPRTIDQSNRGTLVIVDGKTISEHMQELYEKYRKNSSAMLEKVSLNGKKSVQPFEEWYDEKLDDMSVMLIANALMHGGRVEAYVPGPDGTVPETPTQLEMTEVEIMQRPKDAEEEDIVLQSTRVRLKANKRVMEANRLRPGSMFTLTLFPGLPILPSSPLDSNNKRLYGEELQRAVVSTLIGMLAARGEKIEDIMNPTKLQQKRAAVVQEWIANQNDLTWLSEQILLGHMALLHQIDQKMENLDLADSNERDYVFLKLYPAACALSDTVQYVNGDSKMIAEYIRAARRKRLRAETTKQVDALRKRADAVAICLEPGDAFTTKLFLEPYFQEKNEENIHSMEDLRSKIVDGCCYGADSRAVVAACICKMVADGHQIQDILNPEQLQEERLAAVREYVENARTNVIDGSEKLPGHAEWLGEQFYKAHKVMLDQMQNEADYATMYFSDRVLFHTLQTLNEHPRVMEGYIRAAQEELDAERIQAEGTKRANALKGRVDMVANDSLSDSAFTTKLFVEPYFREHVYNIDHKVELQMMIDGGESYRADLDAMVSACICILASKGHQIKDILDPKKLQKERANAVRLYMLRRDDAPWMEDVIRKGNEALQRQITPRDLLALELDLELHPSKIEANPADAIRVRADMEANNLEPGSAFTTELFQCSAYQMDQDTRRLMMSALICILAADGQPIEKILDPEQLQDKRAAVLQEYIRQNNANWLGERIYKGHQALLRQIDSQGYDEIYPTDRVLFHTLQLLDQYPLVQAGYNRAAQEELLQQEAAEQANDLKDRVGEKAIHPEPGDVFTTELFLGPYFQNNEDGVKNIEDLRAKLADWNAYRADSSFLVSACSCILAAEGEKIEDIMNSQNLQEKRADVGTNYIAALKFVRSQAPGEAEWKWTNNDENTLGQQFYNGHKAILEQINQMMTEKDLNDPKVRDAMYFAVRTLFHTLQALDEHPRLMEGYRNAAMQEVISNKDAANAGTNMANQIKYCAENVAALCDLLNQADTFRAMMSRPLPPQDTECVEEGLIVQAMEGYVLQNSLKDSGQNQKVSFSSRCPAALFIKDIRKAIGTTAPGKAIGTTAPGKAIGTTAPVGIKNIADQLMKDDKDWEKRADHILSEKFRDGTTLKVTDPKMSYADNGFKWELNQNGKGQYIPCVHYSDAYRVSVSIIHSDNHSLSMGGGGPGMK